MTGLAAILALAAAASAAGPQALFAPIPQSGFTRSTAPASTEGDFAGPDDETIAAQADRQRRLTVPVHIEGHGPFRFMIDTGAQRTVLSTALAAELGLENGPQLRVAGIVQEARVPSAWVRNLDLGQLTLEEMNVLLLEQAHMGADGIIGTDSLQDRRVLLDLEGDQITVGDSDSFGGKDSYEIVVRARRKSGQLILTNARIDGINVAVVIDTGAENSVGNRALQAALGKRGSSFKPVMLESVTGHSMLADVSYPRALALREVSINNPAIAFTDTPAFAELGLESKPAIFLGMREMRVFSRVAIDFAKRKVLFDLPG
ncbi:MAG: aspartyl protease family protein [Novosphingobium sp.]|nr:aspartyl protease family protein [Novosphingobium sp.]